MIRISGIGCLTIATALLLGAVKTASSFDGYILYGAYGATKTILIGDKNDTIHTWDHSKLTNSLNGYSCYLLPNGNLLRSCQTTNYNTAPNAAPKQGVLSGIDFSGKELWRYELANKTNMLHHDCKIMPNGNLLVVSFVNTTEADAVSKGIDSELFGFGQGAVQTEKIMEIKPDTTGGNQHQVVWEWNMLDHVVSKDQAAQHPEKFSGGLGPFWAGQWVHLNGIDYNPTKDLILFSSRIFSELYVIDHSTTTQQAATGTGGKYNKGGDIIYRWGKSDNYGIQGNSIATLHCPTWIPEGFSNAGNIMFFHNNCLSEGEGMSVTFRQIGRSEVLEITPPADFQRTANAAFGPEAPVWKYAPSGADSIFSMSMSSAIRMKNGNTIVHEAYTGKLGTGLNGASSGMSKIREVTPEGKVVNDTIIQLTVNAAKIMYYEKDNAGIISLFNKLGITKNVHKIATDRICIPKVKYNAGVHILTLTNVADAAIDLYSLQGTKIASVKPGTSTFNFSTRALSTGAYLVTITNAGGAVTTRQFSVL